MSAQAVTLHLPTTLYDHFRRRAEETHRSVETELMEAVAAAVPKEDDLPADLEKALSKLASLDDEALLRAARDRLPAASASRLEALNLKQQREGLTDDESMAQAELLRGYERVMLVRAEAAWLLQQRGHDVSGLVNGG